ncbi:hypothetical protein LR48_Vigan661s000200 [Vigna angularis]|uniref:Uncharacterized protein n=1 Tax=Phaseolus angularis TaxID=3914 RepID=A0A0L9TFG9_PHAAN|nr:hypothetical protein LR48_Vigan661s000200 [Vigna angularis]
MGKVGDPLDERLLRGRTLVGKADIQDERLLRGRTFMGKVMEKWASLRDKVIGSLRVVGCRNDDGRYGLLLPGKLQGCNGDEGVRRVEKVMVKKVVSVAAYSDCHCGVGLDGNMMKMEVRFERRRSLDGSSEASEARVVEEEMIPGSIRLPGWCMVGGNSDEPVVSVIMAQGGWVVWFVLRIAGCMDMDMLFQVLRPSPFCCCVTLVIPLPPSSAELFPPECDGVRENEEEGCMAVMMLKVSGRRQGVARVSDGRRNQQRFHVGARGRQMEVLARNILCFTPFFNRETHTVCSFHMADILGSRRPNARHERSLYREPNHIKNERSNENKTSKPNVHYYDRTPFTEQPNVQSRTLKTYIIEPDRSSKHYDRTVEDEDERPNTPKSRTVKQCKGRTVTVWTSGHNNSGEGRTVSATVGRTERSLFGRAATTTVGKDERLLFGRATIVTVGKDERFQQQWGEPNGHCLDERPQQQWGRTNGFSLDERPQ